MEPKIATSGGVFDQLVFTPMRHSLIVFLTETKRLVAYRAQFWFELILSSLVELVVAISVWQAVFASSGAQELNGYSIQSMVLYITVAIFFGQATKGTGVGTFQREVYEGTLTKYLIFPLSVYSYKFGTYMPRALFAVVQLLVGLTLMYVLGYWPESTSISLGSVLIGFCALFLACLLYFFLIIALEAFSFWADNVWALSYALQIAIVFLSGKAIPLEFFPQWIEGLIRFTPFPYLAYVPAKIFLGQMHGADIGLAFVVLGSWVLLAYGMSKIVMNRGLRNYTGVGQ
ncbi:MAG: ABC-2 family transporter protein [Bdellovibrionales bacterium]|nr:ABC-2 family transporter protein [Bdellovibrionales bacterium]